MTDATAGPHSPLDKLVKENPIKVSHKLVWAVMILLASSVAWAYFITLPEYAVAIGSVVPQSQIKIVQHLEGGIVKDIYVADGDTVSKGDPLIQLDLANTGLNREDLQVRLDGLILTRARLKAEAAGRDPASIGMEAGVAVVGPREHEWKSRVAGWRDMGLTHLCLRTLQGDIPPDQHIDTMRRAVAELPSI